MNSVSSIAVSILIVVSLFVSSSNAQNETESGAASSNETVTEAPLAEGGNETVANTTAAPPVTEAAPVIELDPSVGCYCPGGSELIDFSFDDLKIIHQVIDSKRREAQQEFTKTSIPEDVPVVERSALPSAEVLTSMFPDLGDGFTIDTWVSSLSEITRPAIKEITNLTWTKMNQRLGAADSIRLARAKFDYSALGIVIAAPTEAPAPATEAPAPEVPAATEAPAGTEAPAQTEAPAGDGDATEAPAVEPTDPPAEGRKKRQLTTTTLSPPRVEVISVVPHYNGYGIKTGNGTSLNESVVCKDCGHANTIRRKFIYTSVLFQDDLLDVTTDLFRTAKLDMETKVDDMIYGQMVTDEALFRKGYWGSTVLSFFRSSSEQLGAGRRRKRSYLDGGTGVELELTFRSSSVTDEIIQTMFDTGTIEDMIGESPLAEAQCQVTDLEMDAGLFILDDETITTVAVGQNIYLRCRPGFVMSRTYDTTLLGLPVMCGNNGGWEYSIPLNSSSADVCVETQMCPEPPGESGDGLMELMPYNPVDHSGQIMGGESVYYKCKDNSSLLNDNSGRAVFELLCNVSDPTSPKTAEPSSWPTCVQQTRCEVIPEPDANATASGLLRDTVTDTRTSLMPGEFVVYNCTDPAKPVSETGSFFALECVNGAVTPPTVWPECRPLMGCPSEPENLPVPPAETFLAPIVPMAPIMELQYVNYSCSMHENKTYLPDATHNNMFGVMCMPGGQWQTLETGDWASCDDPTTTTPAPTTTVPPKKKPCYCLGDIDTVNFDSFRMTKDRHKQILKVCRNAWVTFHENKFAKDETGAYNLLPIKEQCGVKDPYVIQYGKEAGTMRNFTYHDTCACVKDPLNSNSKPVEVVGYWMTFDIISLEYDPQNQLITIPGGKSSPIIGKKGNITAKMLEELWDQLFIDELNLYPSRYMRTRFIKFQNGKTIINQDEIDADPTVAQQLSVRVVMEVQFAKPADKSIMTLDTFKDLVTNLVGRNNTLSVTPMPYFQVEGMLGIVVSNNCSETACPFREAPTCVNDDFAKIPDDLIFRHKNMTKLNYPYNITVGGETKQYVGKVGETLDFVCKADKKVFKTDIPELMDSVLTVVCKTDRYYTVPSSGNWPICRAQCDNNVILNKLPTEDTKLMLWEEHPDVKGKLDDLFWEDQKVWYKCIDERNEGIILQQAPEGEIQYGDKKKTSLEYQCLDTGEFNLPIGQFPGCAVKPDTCECLGDMTPEQSMVVLDMMCYEDSYLFGNYHYRNHTDVDKVGLMVLPNKTRCGVKKPDYPTPKDKCHCLEKNPGPERSDAGDGVKTAFWHKMEVLSLPWDEDLFWPNTTKFQEAKRLLERELDTMYLSNSSMITGYKYVRSIVMKFLQGNYRMSYLTSTTSTTTTTTTTSTTTTPPKRGRREVPDNMRDYFYDNTGLRSWRADQKVFIGARGYWDQYKNTELMSTQAWVEHQFVGDFTVEDFNAEDFEFEHLRLLNERNGQWLDESMNTSLWLSQGCYVSRKCIVTASEKCENVILDSLPFGFTSLKSKAQVIIDRTTLATEEYKTPIGGSVDIICASTFQKITVDEVDNDSTDMKLTVMCLPTGKYDIPRDNFPKCRSYCPKPIYLWNQTEMARFGKFTKDVLPLQIGMLPKLDPWDPNVGYKQLEPDNGTDLVLDESQSSFNVELWDGEKLFFTCNNTKLGVEEGASPVVAFNCKSDGTYSVPNKDEWPTCKQKTTTAKPPIVFAVNFSIDAHDAKLKHDTVWAAMLNTKNIGDKDYFWTRTVPCFIFLILLVVGILFFTRNDSICCQVCNRDFEIKQMQNYGHSDYEYE